MTAVATRTLKNCEMREFLLEVIEEAKNCKKCDACSELFYIY